MTNPAGAPPNVPGRATMHDVAREAGVSAMTVSRALKQPDKVASATRARIAEAVARLGYVPDQVAGSLASGESRLVAALVSTLTGSIFASTIQGLNQGLRAEGHELLLGTTDYSKASEEALLRATLSRRPDGLVLTSGVHTPATRELLCQLHVPVVEVWDLPERPIDTAVGFSNEAAGRAMTAFLAELGYRRIGFVGAFGAEDHRGQARRVGYRAQLRDSGLGPFREVDDRRLHHSSDWPAGGMIECGARSLAALLQAHPDCDAVFCASDAAALGALMEARRQGLEVPARLAIAGLGDFEYAGDHGLGLTTLAIPGQQIGLQAARLLLARKRGDVAAGQRLDLGFTPIRRATA